MSEQESRRIGFSLAARLMFSIFLVSVCICVPNSVTASVAGKSDSSGGTTNLRDGKDLLEKKKYKEALESFKSAYDDLPAVRDYILFFMAKAYRGLDRPDDTAECLRKILKAYPDSPLKKRVRALEINSGILDGDAHLAHLQSFVTDYPEDAEMTFTLARLLKEAGKTDQSRKLLVRLYTGTTSYSEKAYKELGSSGVTAEEKIARAANLMKAFEYRKAEIIVRKVLSSAVETQGDELQKMLGFALFGQKKYKDAAAAFLKAGDFYNGARSFLRAGDLNAFREVTSKLVFMEDNRVASLLIVYAAKKRREGAAEEALRIYGDVKKDYPSRTEDALWGIAWTHFRTRENDAALRVLTELANKYPDPKYRYWKQKCSGADASRVQAGRKVFYRDIYSLMSDMKDAGSISGRLATQAAWTPGQDISSPSNISLPSDVHLALERFAILTELEMKEDAVSELLRVAGRISRPDVLLYICRKLQEAGAYNRSVALLSKFPGTTEQNEVRRYSLLYPFAYWSVVSETSRRYTLDPLVLLSVMREESRFDPSARSAAGALGLMQIMPETAYAMDRKLGLNISDANSLYNIGTNIALGASHLNSLLKELGSLPAALAAYNAGRDKVKEWLKAGNYESYDEFIEDIPYDETRNYVKRVLLTYSAYLKLGETH